MVREGNLRTRIDAETNDEWHDLGYTNVSFAKSSMSTPWSNATPDQTTPSKDAFEEDITTSSSLLNIL
jgi:hypothetical protein